MDLYPPYILRPVCQHTRGHVPSVSAYAYGGLGGIRSMLIHQVGVSTVYVRYDLNYTLHSPFSLKYHKWSVYQAMNGIFGCLLLMYRFRIIS